MGISAVVLTYNDREKVERCLSSLRFADEIVVLDSFSDDGTFEIVQKFADFVDRREFTGFSDQWNAALKMATQDWVLIIGSDEVVTPPLAKELTIAAAKGKCDGYSMPRLTQFLGREIRHCGWYPDYQLRLAKREKAYFPDRLVHESLEVDGKCGVLKSDLLHYSYPTMDEFSRKMVLYARSAAQQKMLEGRRFRIGDLVWKPGLTFFKHYVLKQGFRDGFPGFVLSLLLGCSSALRYAYLWEMTMREDRK